jgi:hypothetical protein
VRYTASKIRHFTNQSLEGEENTGPISERMIRSIEHYPAETIVVVHAKLRKAPKRVKNATIHDHELEVYEVHKVTNLTENVPFTVYDAENISRDKEDVDDDDDTEDASLLSDEGAKSPDSNRSRASQDVSRISIDKITGRSRHPFTVTKTHL